MQTNFSLAQLADPDIAEADRIRVLRALRLLHRDLPDLCAARRRARFAAGADLPDQDMLENDRPATADVVKHIDRCLSCLACMTTCPSGVHYMHLVDHARAHVESTYSRPLIDRVIRAMIARVLPHNQRLRLALGAARLFKPMAGLFAALGLGSVAAMLRLAPDRRPATSPGKGRRGLSQQGSVADGWRC
jgi:glycolate oxidase iron-sulfur subunit